MEENLKFSWGDTKGVRNILSNIYKNISNFQSIPVDMMGYPPYEGDELLVQRLRTLTEFLTRRDYKYIAVTAGATQALSALVFALRNNNTESIITRELYYPRYKEIAQTAYLSHVDDNSVNKNSDNIQIVDSPSNPLGLVGSLNSNTTKFTILDAAYHSPTYGIVPGITTIPDHDVYVGSLSKLTGVNGIRLGWIATNNNDIFDKTILYMKAHTCGISLPSQWLANQILYDYESLHKFFSDSAELINSNKEEILKLKSIFGDDSMPKYGMFAFYKTDSKMKNIFKKAKVEFTDGRECGAKEDSVRINLGNPFDMTKEMVKRVLKSDKVK